MPRKHDYVPGGDKEFNDWFLNLVDYVEQKTGGLGAEWHNIQEPEVMALKSALFNWKTYYEPTLHPHTPAVTTAKNEARKNAEEVVRYFVQRYLVWDKPVTDADRVNMGIPIKDTIRTPIGFPGNTVRLKLKLSVPGQLTIEREIIESGGDPRADHGVRIHYGVVVPNPAAQSALTGKQYYLSELPHTPEQLKEDFFMSSKSHTEPFPHEDSGHTAVFCGRVESKTGKAGKFGELVTAVIPEHSARLGGCAAEEAGRAGAGAER
jgi:hypothetical protein